MKSLLLKAVVFISTVCLLLCCREEEVKPYQREMLIGKWNLYETYHPDFGSGDARSNPCRCLTWFYEDGLSFANDGTFGTRHLDVTEPGWTESSGVGHFEFKDNSIFICTTPGAENENRLELHILKLDEHHLWFKHSFTPEREYRLERVE
jgi:hypothetical protein